MEFSDTGRKAFAETTREIAQRGADNAVLNGGVQNPITPRTTSRSGSTTS